MADPELPKPDDPDLGHDDYDKPDGDDSVLEDRYGSS